MKVIRYGLAIAIISTFVSYPLAAARDKRDYTEIFPFSKCEVFTASTADDLDVLDDGARNRFFPLRVGQVLNLTNEPCVEDGECDELETVALTVMDETVELFSVTARVVEEWEEAEGDVTEVSRNFFVECAGSEDIYMLGEDVCVPEGSDGALEGPPPFEFFTPCGDIDEGLVPGGGAWRAGEDDALPGLFMPGGAILLGARFHLELAPDVAMDRAEVVDIGIDLEVEAGELEDCVVINDSNLLEGIAKELDEKVYCSGVGLVIDEELELESIEP